MTCGGKRKAGIPFSTEVMRVAGGPELQVEQGRLELLLEQLGMALRIGVEQRELDQEQFGLVLAGLVDGGRQGVVDGFQAVDGEGVWCGYG